MKEFENIPPKPDKVEVVNQRQVDYEKKFLGTTHRHKGHTMFEINCKTGEIKEAEYSDEKIVLVPHRCLLTGAVTKTEPLVVRDIVCRDDSVYISALNKKTAKKKFYNWLFEQSVKSYQNIKREV